MTGLERRTLFCPLHRSDKMAGSLSPSPKDSQHLVRTLEQGMGRSAGSLPKHFDLGTTMPDDQRAAMGYGQPTTAGEGPNPLT